MADCLYTLVWTSGFIIPAKAGIQCFQEVAKGLDTGFHRCDDFLREHQSYGKNLHQSLLILKTILSSPIFATTT